MRSLTFERLWGILPVPVLALRRLPGRLVGLSLGVLVLVRGDHAADRPTIIHELEHCKQFWRGGGVLHMVRYYVSRDYRLRVELEAFRAELQACAAEDRAERLEDAARALASGYHLDLDVATCRRQLTCCPPSATSSPTSWFGAFRRPNSSNAVMGRSTDTTGR